MKKKSAKRTLGELYQGQAFWYKLAKFVVTDLGHPKGVEFEIVHNDARPDGRSYYKGKNVGEKAVLPRSTVVSLTPINAGSSQRVGVKRILAVILIALVTTTACNKAEKEAEEARRKALLEQQRQEDIYREHLHSIGSSPAEWVRWYVEDQGVKEGEATIYRLEAGKGMYYVYDDTIRKGKLTEDLYGPKLGKENAFIAGPQGARYTITNWNDPKLYRVVAQRLPDRAPVPLVLEIGEESSLLWGVLDEFLEFDIPSLHDLWYYSIPGSTFVYGQGRKPGELFIVVYDGDEEMARYLATEGGEIHNIGGPSS